MVEDTRTALTASLAAAGKRIGRGIVPQRRRPQLRGLYNRLTWVAYRGYRVACPCCHGNFRRFRPFFDGGRQFAMCPRCGSLGRQRVDWLFLRNETNLLRDPLRLLHVAPEESLKRCFENLANVVYLSADYDSALAMERMDVRDIHHADGSFDAIVCNHVLEHVVEDRQAMSEFYRVLMPGGWALLQTPIDHSRPRTFEDLRVTDEGERERLFGQHDHVRIYGCDYVDRLRSVGFDVTPNRYVDTLPRGESERMGLDLDEEIYFCRKPVSTTSGS